MVHRDTPRTRRKGRDIKADFPEFFSFLSSLCSFSSVLLACLGCCIRLPSLLLRLYLHLYLCTLCWPSLSWSGFSKVVARNCVFRLVWICKGTVVTTRTWKIWVVLAQGGRKLKGVDWEAEMREGKKKRRRGRGSVEIARGIRGAWGCRYPISRW